jgi:hypothetical protein
MSGSGSEYGDDNVIRPKAFEGTGTSPMGGGLGGGDGGGMMLDAGVARLESDVAHIQRDLTAVQGELRAVASSVQEMRADVGIIKESSNHLATKSWVLTVFGSMVVFVVTVLTAAGTFIAAYSPKLQILFGTAPP